MSVCRTSVADAKKKKNLNHIFNTDAQVQKGIRISGLKTKAFLNLEFVGYHI
jgi:hypothetical protein